MLKVLVRVAPEINIKTPKIKARFLRTLIRNIEDALEAASIQHHIDERWSRLMVELDSEEGVAILTRIFGVGSVSPIEHECESQVDVIGDLVLSHYTEAVAGKTFCVRVKRSGAVKGITSHEAERLIGARLAPHALKVNLTKPEFKVEVEMTQHGSYIFTNRLPGPGGLPLGSQGKALCLISGGFDSAVAAWRMMKRGVSLDYVFCNLAGGAYERSVLAVVKGLCERWSHGTRPKVHVLDFSPVVKAIDEHVSPHYSQVVLKRLFYRCCSRVADHAKAHALVTGEAVGQVSSQTLSNLAAIDAVSNKLILRPLISFDKEEILDIARDIGTYLLCEHIQEYCALNNKKPVTATSVAQLDEQESKLPEGLVDEVLDRFNTIRVAELSNKELMTQYLFTEEIDSDTVIIDTRDKMEYRAWHYPGALHLPLATAAVAYKQFDKTKRYVLVCPFGLQTAVLAELMQKSGFEAYSFEKGARGLMKYEKKA
ncbi:thiamine biosynthesis protein ThiI [Pseudobacteriovorax antillogorgiicola]|uniref:tRNA sulfurtransferase n=1 Tax=Pseudobacteriovorax antillogorgiicola TaxID=1513793 RepID=A0A1Y6B7S4_9BACT|nr:thiamine biosynthesis protein ThiI [Pseudobacteriovorax antillogorgiicola]SME97491.1 thiamine biosynthesis protein ThiI [Pseudobacteriovorax antillogorgiicola]